MYSHKDKAKNIGIMNRYMLAKTIPMFEYEGLPETIPYRELEKMLQSSGYVFVTKINGELYAVNGGLGGVQDAYGNPTQIVVSNPALNFNANLDLEKDGVLIRNDDLMIGLLPLYEKFNFMMAENDINMILYGYNTRMNKLISASDDKTRESAERYVTKAVEGDIAIVGENAIFEGVKLQTGNAQSSSSIGNLIEYGQYLKATLYNEVGLASNTNLKRERLISAEVQQGEDSLFPLVFTMMKCRIAAVEKINAMFGTSIKVDFGSVWHLKHREMVDNVIDDKPLNGVTENEPELENGSSGADTGSTGNSDPKEEELAEIEKMLADESLSDEDRKFWEEMKAELENKENDKP